jgi:hypothetical protein
MNFAPCKRKCKLNIFSIIVEDPIKQCKCKIIHVYMILHGYVEKCKYIIV